MSLFESWFRNPKKEQKLGGTQQSELGMQVHCVGG